MEAEPPKADPLKRKRRWFQFSLRTLMIGGTVLASALANLLCPALCPSAELSETDRNEVRRVVEGLDDGSRPMPPGWTLGHAASEEGLNEVERIGYAGDLEAVVSKAGGWAKYKAAVASLLKSKDVVVRGFAACWLADLGDRGYTKDLLAVLEADTTPTTNNVFPDYDRGEAATALGILGAREHDKDLVKYLKHKSAQIRAGAALGYRLYERQGVYKGYRPVARRRGIPGY